MRAELLPAVLTPMAPRDVLRAFRNAYQDTRRLTPSNAVLALLVAQSALETGRWRSIYCHNFGNVKAGPDYEGYYCQFRCNEVIGGKLQWFDPPHPQTNFRAFLSADAGAADHLQFLSGRKRYAESWRALLTGDPVAYVAELRRAGYFTADEAPYRRAVVSLFGEYMRALDGEPVPDDDAPDTEPSWEDLRALVARQQFTTEELLHGADNPEGAA